MIPFPVVNTLRETAQRESPLPIALFTFTPDGWGLANLGLGESVPAGATCVAVAMHAPGVSQTLIAEIGLLREHAETRLRDLITHHVRLGDLPGSRVMRRPCWPKERHLSEGAAQAQLRSITKRHLEKSDHIHVYRCNHCSTAAGQDVWHVGH